MEEQTNNAAVEEVTESPAKTEEVAKESQPEVSEADVVSEEEVDVQETEPEEEEVEAPKEPEGEEPQEEPQEEDIPFTERPGVKERLSEIEEKYGSKAKYWDSIAELTKEDPEFRVAVLEKLEASGKLPKGTAEAEKKKFSSLQESEKYIEKLPEDVQADLRAARELRQQREAQKAVEMQKAQSFFMDFEKERPDIAQSANPDATRNLIYNLATQIAQTDEIEFTDAMDEAYKTILHRSEQENDAVKRKVQQVQEDSGAVPSGSSGKTTKLRKLSQSEKRAAELAGMTHEEYVKYADTPEEELFENI
jgi:hypothetical protein